MSSCSARAMAYALTDDAWNEAHVKQHEEFMVRDVPLTPCEFRVDELERQLAGVDDSDASPEAQALRDEIEAELKSMNKDMSWKEFMKALANPESNPEDANTCKARFYTRPYTTPCAPPTASQLHESTLHFTAPPNIEVDQHKCAKMHTESAQNADGGSPPLLLLAAECVFSQNTTDTRLKASLPHLNLCDMELVPQFTGMTNIPLVQNSRLSSRLEHPEARRWHAIDILPLLQECNNILSPPFASRGPVADPNEMVVVVSNEDEIKPDTLAKLILVSYSNELFHQSNLISAKIPHPYNKPNSWIVNRKAMANTAKFLASTYGSYKWALDTSAPQVMNICPIANESWQQLEAHASSTGRSNHICARLQIVGLNMPMCAVSKMSEPARHINHRIALKGGSIKSAVAAAAIATPSGVALRNDRYRFGAKPSHVSEQDMYAQKHSEQEMMYARQQQQEAAYLVKALHMDGVPDDVLDSQKLAKLRQMHQGK